MKIAINAQVVPHSGGGGFETVLAGLIKSLGKLTDGPEEYTIIGRGDAPECWEPYVGPNQRIVPGPIQPQLIAPKRESLKRALGPLRRPATKATRWMFPLPPPSLWREVPISDGFYEGLGCNVIHFPYHDFVFCAIPSVYNPHDLQHRHFPEFFERSVLAWRESIYPMACRLAQVVAVTSQWIKQDVERQYSVNANKIQVIPWAPPTEIYASPTAEDLEAARRKFDLAQEFALYPAMTYEHKNHVRLLEAVASLRDREGLRVHLVCTGAKQPFWSEIEKHLQRLGLQDQVKFPGMVSPEELRCFYRLAKFVIVPTLFEAASGPLFEAWQDGVPAACSSVTSLPEQAGDAALLFDPYSVESIAEAIRRMATEPALLDQLRGNGARRLQDFSWERTARAYRALYRRLAHSALTDEDRRLLEWDWMKDARA